MGHTMSIHSRNEQVILEFGLHKPAYRICVNTPATLGAIGLTTGLDPAMTLGCGGFGGNITSDNISPRHLLNIKRLAYEIRPYRSPRPAGQSTELPAPAAEAPSAPRLPQAPAKPPQEPIAADALTRRIDAFLASRGVSGTATMPSLPAASGTIGAPVPFVCEDDVRIAVKEGKKILVGDKTIITPAARDAGEAARIFVWPSFRS
jgi:acetaldehyde dehydrogenase (acetylating)